MKHLFLIVCLCGLWTMLSAQHFYCVHYDQDTGLPTDKINHVAKDSLGFLWIATDQGVVRFDGRTFHSYPHASSSRYARQLCPVPQGVLYSHDAGVSLISPRLSNSSIGTFLTGGVLPTDSLLHYPNTLFQQPGGSLWISGARGRIFRHEAGKPLRTSVISDTLGWSMLIGTDSGQVWVGGSSGSLYRYDAVADRLRRVGRVGAVRDMVVRGDQLWVAGDALYRFPIQSDGRLARPVIFRTPLGLLTALALDARGQVYVGIADYGLYKLEERRGSDYDFVKVFSNNEPHRVEELPYRNINHLVVGTEGLWICSQEGLGLLQERLFEMVPGVPNSGLAAFAASGAELYASIGSAHLIRRTPNGFSPQVAPFAGEGVPTALAATPDAVYVGYGDGTLTQRRKDGTIAASLDLSGRGEGVFFLLPTADQRLWVCQAPSSIPIMGVGCWLPDGQFKEYGAAHGIDNRILVLRKTPRGRVYAAGIGRKSYLYRYLPQEDHFVNLSLDFDFPLKRNFEVHDLAVDAQGTVWLATTDGLLRQDLDRVDRVDLGSRYEDIEIRSVVCTKEGGIWFASDTEGVFHYHDGNLLSLKEASGLPSKIMAYRGLLMDDTNCLWVGTAEGLVYMTEDPSSLLQTPSPYLLTVKIGGQVATKKERYEFYQGLPLQVSAILPIYHGNRTLYQHRIEQGEWSAPTDEPNWILSDLPVGEYGISIRAKREGGYQWSEATVLPVRVRLQWFQQRWVQWLGIGLLVAAIVTWMGGRQYAYRQRIRLLRRALRRANPEDTARQATSEHLPWLHRVAMQVQGQTEWGAIGFMLAEEVLGAGGGLALAIIVKTQGEDWAGYYHPAEDNTKSHETDVAPSGDLDNWLFSAGQRWLTPEEQRAIDELGLEGEQALKGLYHILLQPFGQPTKGALLWYVRDRSQLGEAELRAAELLGIILPSIPRK